MIHHVERVAGDDGTFHGAATYMRVIDFGQVEWIEHKAHSQRMTKLDAVILCRMLRLEPEGEGFCFWPVQS